MQVLAGCRTGEVPKNAPVPLKARNDDEVATQPQPPADAPGRDPARGRAAGTGHHAGAVFAGIVDRHPTLARLRDPNVFSTAKVGEHGACVIWADDDDLELAADNLRARAVEQAGGVSHEFVGNWMARHGLTLDTAAEALGVSRRMLAYCRSGAEPVPRTVALACLGWEKARKAGAQALAA